MATITVDLTTLTNYNSLPDGVYTIKCVAKGLGIYTPSNMSLGASSYRKGTYTISTSVSNGTFTGDTSVRYGLDASVTITPNSGYGLPSTVSISGSVGSYNYNSTTGVILLTNVTGNVSITGACIRAYAVIVNITNGTYSGDSYIVDSGTASVTVVPNTWYDLPSSITVSGASYSYNNSTGVISLSSPTSDVSITVVCTQQQLSAPTISRNGDILSITDVPNAESYDIYDGNTVVANVVPLTMPAKGDLIMMNVDGSDKQFRVLNMNGNNAEVVAMFNSSDSHEFASSGQVYAGSALDTHLNTTWYNTLNATAKAAIVDKTFTQDSWYTTTSYSGYPRYSGYYGTTKPGTTAYIISLGNAAFGNSITRHVYALSVQDVLDYILDTSITDGQLRNYNIWQMFWNDEVQHTGLMNYFWLRSALASSASDACRMNGYNGRVDHSGSTYTYGVRPAFTIDLSKITWSKVV